MPAHRKICNGRNLVALFLLVCVSLGIQSSVAFGDTITCSHSYGYCGATNGNDNIHGWSNSNEIDAKTGRDNAWAASAQDWLWGGSDGDALNGGEGPDIIRGEYGNDSYLEISGSAGLFGQSGNDDIEGNVGRDFLEGNSGSDNMRGGDSADTIYAEDGTYDVVNGGAGEPPYVQPCYVDGYDAWTACEPH